MNTYEELNRSKAPEFYDDEKGIRYMFVGFAIPPTYEEKLSLISLKGSPRQTDRVIKTDDFKIEEATPEFEVQMIYHEPPGATSAQAS